MFRKLRGVKIPYVEQGIIYFTCMNYSKQSNETRNKIEALCKQVCTECGSEATLYENALFEFLTNQYIGAVGIVMKYCISDKRLYQLRREFYERW